MAKGNYSYRWDSSGGFFNIYENKGIWKLDFYFPNRIVLIANSTFPTKRAAKKFATNMVWENYIVKDNFKSANKLPIHLFTPSA